MPDSRMASIQKDIRSLYLDGTFSGLSDHELLQRFAERSDRSESIFRALIERHGVLVMRVCRAILPDANDADDAFQATFLVLARRAGSLWVKESIGPWLHGVATRVALRARLNAHRRRHFEESVRNHKEELIGDPGETAHQNELSCLLHEELARLPECWRSPLILCHLEGLTHEEAATRLGIPLGTVRSRLSRGRNRLRKRLIRRGLLPGTAWAVTGSCGRDGIAAASVSTSLINQTSSLAFAQTVVRSAIPTYSIASLQLAQGAIKAMLFTKAKGVVLLVLLSGSIMSMGMIMRNKDDEKAAVIEAIEQKDRESDIQPEPESAPEIQGKRISKTFHALDDSINESSAEWKNEEGRKVTQSLANLLEATVRIRSQSPGSVVFGSGTVIKSDGHESIVMTCSRSVAVDTKSSSKQANTIDQIKVDLFDASERVNQIPEARLRETVSGEVIDFDHDTNVALIKIRPGRRLKAAPIVPPHWIPQKRMRMRTVGCSEGRDPTTWLTTVNDVQAHALQGQPRYVCIECETAPKQGRTGGGLFTDDGYLAGVCNFAEPKGNVGLYAHPQLIHAMLDRNKLRDLYVDLPTPTEPDRLEALIAKAERISAVQHDAKQEFSRIFSLYSSERDSLHQETLRLDLLGRRVENLKKKYEATLSKDAKAESVDKPNPRKQTDRALNRMNQSDQSFASGDAEGFGRRIAELERKLERVLDRQEKSEPNQ